MLPFLAISGFGHTALVPTYDSLLLIAALVTFGLALVASVQRGIPMRPASLLLVAASLSAVVGARLLYAALNLPDYVLRPSAVLAFEASHFALYGGLVLACMIVPMMARRERVNLWTFADACTPALWAGVAIAKFGCLLRGCCFGTTTDALFGVRFPAGSPAYQWQVTQHLIRPGDVPLLVQPVQLFEVMGAIACAVLAVWLMRTDSTDGTAFVLTVLVFSAFRLVEAPLRVQSDTLPHAAQVAVIVPLVVTLLCVSFWRRLPKAVQTP